MSANLLRNRYEQFVTVFTGFYMNHPDAEVYAPDHRVVLAKCMATKAAYRVMYGEDVENALKRLNQWRAVIRED